MRHAPLGRTIFDISVKLLIDLILTGLAYVPPSQTLEKSLVPINYRENMLGVYVLSKTYLRRLWCDVQNGIFPWR